jgi:hypothetical protein
MDEVKTVIFKAPDEEQPRILFPASLLEETADLARKLKSQPYEVQYAMIMQLVDVMDEEDQYLIGAGILADVCDLEEGTDLTGEDHEERKDLRAEAMMYG